MFTAQELEYLNALVETMRGRGYDYYVARTVTESNNSYDFEVVFSDKEITANGLYSYSGCSGVIYRVDSSASVNYSDAKVQVSDFFGSYNVPQREFVYSNAVFQGGTIQPDLRELGGVQSESNQAGFYLLALFLLVVVAIKLFRAG